MSDGRKPDETAASSRQQIFCSLSLNERRRRLWHMLPGFLPLSWWVLPHSTPLSFTWQASLCALAIVMSIVTYVFGKSFARPDESRPWGSFVSYVSMVLAPVLLFPSHPEFSATVLAVLAFGDGAAALGGLVLRGPKLPWNQDKSWAGTICFLLGSAPAATLFFWGEMTPPQSWGTALLFAGSAALVGDLVESIPSQINDNIRVGLAANVVLVVLQTVLFGW